MPGGPGSGRTGLRWFRLLRPWLAVLGGCVAVAALVPPAGEYARQYVFAESLQFLAFAVVAPALLALGAPWRTLRLDRTSPGPGVARASSGPGVARAAAGPGVARATAVMLVFLAACVAWRLPAAMSALVRYPGLAVAELASLLAAGTALWLELVPSPPFRPRVSRLLRAVMAAVAMWGIWVLGYILGFARGVWSAGYVPAAGHGLSAAADQQIAAGLLWAVPAVCFVPVIFACALSWLAGAEDLDEELRRISATGPTANGPSGHGGRLRPPRGWR